MTISRKLRLAAASLLALSLAACGENPAPRPGPSLEPVSQTGMCAVSQKRNGIEFCRQLYPGTKPIHLPNDPSAKQRYGAVTRGGMAFHTRAGDLPLSAAVKTQLNNADGPGRVAYAKTVYLATISHGAVTRLRPVAEIDENVVLKALFGGRAMEGRISSLAGPGAYTDARTFAIRIEFTTNPVDGSLAGRIVNASSGIRGAQGTCLPALTTRGNPLTGPYTAAVKLQRFPAMHAAFDDELLLAWNQSNNNMGTEYYPSIATLLGGDPLGARWQTAIHGTPNTGPSVTLHLVTGGGGAC